VEEKKYLLFIVYGQTVPKKKLDFLSSMLLINASNMQPLFFIYNMDMLLWYVVSLSLICSSITSLLTCISNHVEERGRPLLIEVEEEKRRDSK
jgi:hypothetical protein